MAVLSEQSSHYDTYIMPPPHPHPPPKKKPNKLGRKRKELRYN